MRTVLQKGFTITEVLIALVIMSVLAGLAIPSYWRTIEQGRANEATTNLSIIHMAQKLYYRNNGSVYYSPGNGVAVGTASTALSVDMSATFYTTLNINATGGASYTARFTRNNVQGGQGSRWYENQYTRNGDTLTQNSGGNF